MSKDTDPRSKRDFPASRAYSDVMEEIARSASAFPKKSAPTDQLAPLTYHTIIVNGKPVLVMDTTDRIDEEAMEETLQDLFLLTGFRPPRR